jgi:hypothetical protein
MLTWLNSLNVGGVVAVVAAVIALLRAVVSLVPSPKLAADINPVIAFLAGIVGMSGKEGVQQAGPPITESGKNGFAHIPALTCLAICLLILGGAWLTSCTTTSTTNAQGVTTMVKALDPVVIAAINQIAITDATTAFGLLEQYDAAKSAAQETANAANQQNIEAIATAIIDAAEGKTAPAAALKTLRAK